MAETKTRTLKIWLLGLSIDPVREKEAVYKINQLIHSYRNEPQYVATVNTDFIANAIGFFGIKNFEFLKVLRNAKVVVADGYPLVLLSKILGNPLPARVTGQDLMPLLIKSFADQKRSIYLLGGTQDIIEKTVTKMLLENPFLKIDGFAAPRIAINGQDLIMAPEADQLILNKINDTDAELLFLQLGSPKQEIWFDRVKNSLNIPIAMGVGGAFERYVGWVKRAPRWMQENGLEWLYRMIQEPARLIKRYSYDLVKLFWLSCPLIVYFYLNKWITSITHIRSCLDDCERQPYLYLSPDKNLIVIKLPCLFDLDGVERVINHFDDGLEQDALIVDFKNLRHIDLYGFDYLAKIWGEAKALNKRIFAINVSSHIVNLFKLNRLWDVLEKDVTDIKGVLEQLNTRYLFQSINQEEETLTLSFLGPLTNEEDYDQIIRNLLQIVDGKQIRIDLDYATLVENRAESFLMKLENACRVHMRQLNLASLKRQHSKN